MEILFWVKLRHIGYEASFLPAAICRQFLAGRTPHLAEQALRPLGGIPLFGVPLSRGVSESGKNDA